MPFFRPSLKDIRKRRISDFEYELGSQAARVPGTVEHALAVSGSGTSHGLHGRLDVVAKNAFPHLAEDESLVKWANFYGVTRLEAEPAGGLLLVSPTLGVDTLCPNAVQLADLPPISWIKKPSWSTRHLLRSPGWRALVTANGRAPLLGVGADLELHRAWVEAV